MVSKPVLTSAKKSAKLRTGEGSKCREKKTVAF